MRSVNRVALLGKLVGVPERRSTGTKPVANFSIETTESWLGRDGEERRVTIHDCVAFGPIARSIEVLKAGDHVYVEGSLRAERGDDSNLAAEVVCSMAIPVAEPAELEEVAGDLREARS